MGIRNPRMEYKKIWTGKRFDTSLLVLKAPLSLIKVRHFEKGLISVRDSPHFDYVLSELGVRGSGSASERLEYRDYHRRQFGRDEKYLDSKEKAFQSLMSVFLGGSAKFEILVIWDPSAQVFCVLDGFHRLACIAALAPDQLVTCRIAS